MRSLATIRQFMLLAMLPIAVSVSGCLDEVPSDEGDAQPTEEELSGDGQPEDSGDLIIESGIGVSGALNLYDDQYYEDTRRVRYSYDTNFGNDGFNDKASSVSNRTGYYWLLFEHSYYGGARLCIRPYSRISSLYDFKYEYTPGFYTSWNDTISSVEKQGTSSTSCRGARIVGLR